MKKSRPEIAICVLGMHRSGTSCLTGSLQKSGLTLGKYHARNPYNKKGNRENQDVVDLHEQLLSDNGGSWDKPPANIDWQESHIRAAESILASYSRHEYWGFKDPRTLVVLDGWKSLIPDIRCIGIYRHPDSVAASLAKRNAMPREQALAIWYHYNNLLLREYRRQRFPLLCFDWSETKFHDELEFAIGQLGLPRTIAEDRFFTDSLRRHNYQGYDDLPGNILQLYRNLQTLHSAGAQ